MQAGRDGWPSAYGHVETTDQEQQDWQRRIPRIQFRRRDRGVAKAYVLLLTGGQFLRHKKLTRERALA